METEQGNKDFKFVGHAGYGTEAPFNSIEGFKKCIDSPLDGIQTHVITQKPQKSITQKFPKSVLG